MIHLNIHEAKTHLSKYLDQIVKGEVVVLCKRNVPIAEIRAIEKTSTEPRPIGLAEGEFELSDAFFEPLPDDLIQAFHTD